MGYLYVIISAIGFGVMSIFAKLAYSNQVNLASLLPFRFLIATVILWVMVIWKKLPYRLDKKTLLTMVLMGVFGYAIMSQLFFLSLQTISASLAALLLYLYPSLVTLLSIALRIEQLTKQKISALVISFLGLLLTLGIFNNSLNYAIGIIYAFLANVVYSIYIIVGHFVTKKVHPLVLSAYITGAASIALFFVNLLRGEINLNFPFTGWLYIILIAIFSTVIAVYTFFLGVERIGPAKASIISTIEPVVTISLAYILFQEKLSFLQIIGGILILYSIILLSQGVTNSKIKNSLQTGENLPN